MDFQHFLITRFNLSTGGREEDIRSRSGWLPRRIDLFERYCLPSVCNQSKKNFLWLIYVDVTTPQKYRHFFEKFNRLDFVDIRWVDGRRFDIRQVKSDVSQLLHFRTKWLITTRLDNDDAIARDFVQRVQAFLPTEHRVIINFTQGLILKDGRIYRHRDCSNAFATMVEPPDSPLTIWCRHHTELRFVAPIRQVDDRPMWCQIIHDDNVSNRVNGWRLSTAELTTHFGFSKNELLVTPSWTVMAENATLYPLRLARHRGRRALRTLIQTYREHFAPSPRGSSHCR